MLSTYFIGRILPADMWDRHIEIEHDIIMACARMLSDSEMMWLWRVNPAEARRLMEQEIDRINARHWNKTAQRELKESFEVAARKALESDEVRYRRAYEAGALPVQPVAIAESAALTTILQTGYLSADRVLRRARMTGKNVVLNKLSNAVESVLGGEVSIDAALRTAVNDLSAMGIDGHTYPSGARISLAPYVRREVTTAVMNTTRQLSLARAKEWGSDLIVVSSHAGARPKCFPYQARVFSLSGRHPKYPDLYSTSYGQPDGLLGINCRHFLLPWFEGLNEKPSLEERDPARHQLGIDNNVLYEQTQRQRYNERQIRKWKRRESELEGVKLNSDRARQKVRYWQKQQREFLKGKELRRDYTREAA